MLRLKAPSAARGLAAWYGQLNAALALVAGFDQTLKAQTVVQTRGEVERIIMLSTSADMAGLPLAPPGLVLRLMPYLVPHVYQWRRTTQGLTDFSSNVKSGC